MRKYVVIILLGIMVLPACKSNLEAYNIAYQKLKEKEVSQMNSRAKTTMEVHLDSLSNDSSVIYRTENLTLLLGKENLLMEYNVVAKTFINRTNARGYYDQMKEDGYPALLVQNQDQLYRIIIASFSTPELAEVKKAELKEKFPEINIVVRKN
ncbi:MAG TPA: SPOR domain-containing protein [Bacteroidales bacterium]|nr:SPOR domain-containing protein [Bacteroidales bacterium]